MTITNWPRWVSRDIMEITKPPGSLPSYYIEENRKYLVASGEQSLLYMANKGRLPKGRYLTTTPCFRNESIGVMSKKCFIKTELMITNENTEQAMLRVIMDATAFFTQALLDYDVPENIISDKLQLIETDEGRDIEFNGIELGSYGIRVCPFLTWVYGTGCAEPRLTRAIKSLE